MSDKKGFNDFLKDWIAHNESEESPSNSSSSSGIIGCVFVLVVLVILYFVICDDVGGTKESSSTTSQPSHSSVEIPEPPVTAPVAPVAPVNNNRNKLAAKEYILSGMKYIKSADYELAITDLTKAIPLDTTNPDAYYGRGRAYMGKGDNSRAIMDYSVAIRLNPNDAALYSHRGVAYARTGNHDAAIGDFETALRIEPNNESIKNNLEKLRQRQESSASATTQQDNTGSINQVGYQGTMVKGSKQLSIKFVIDWLPNGEIHNIYTMYTKYNIPIDLVIKQGAPHCDYSTPCFIENYDTDNEAVFVFDNLTSNSTIITGKWISKKNKDNVYAVRLEKE